MRKRSFLVGFHANRANLNCSGKSCQAPRIKSLRTLVACAGFEPARQKAADFKSAGSTDSPNRPTRLGTAPSGYGLLGTADGPPEFCPNPHACCRRSFPAAS